MKVVKKKKVGNSIEGSKAKKMLEKTLDTILNAPAFTDPAAAYLANLEAINSVHEEAPVTQEQWELLYEVAKNIKAMAPWNFLHESEHINILLPGRDEPITIVVMGSGEMTFGIGIFPGYDALRRLEKMMELELEEDGISAAFEQHCINLYFGNRDELETEDKNVIKKLGLKFRGKNEWPYFRSMKPGFMPWHINYDEAELAIAALQNFAMAFLSYAKKEVEVDFDNGETLLRFYDSETEYWCNVAIKMPIAPTVLPKLIISDEILTAKLKKKKKNRTKLGFALTYFPMPIQDNEKFRPKLSRIALLLDLKSGAIIDQALDTEFDSIENAVVNLITDYVENNGRPASIAFSGEEARIHIEDFATKIGVKLEENEKLADVGNLLISVMESMMNSDLFDNLKDLFD